jgi:hypothetical protein
VSQWRRKALSTFPDRAPALTGAFSIYDLLGDLLFDLQAAYKDGESERIDRVWAFAGWCFEPRRHSSVRNAVAVSFYEHIPHFGPAARDMPNRVSLDVFRELLPAFRVTLDDQAYDEFVRAFLTAKGERVPKRRSRRKGAA